MSRIGKRPIPIPNKVTVTVDGQKVTVNGPSGELSQVLPDEVSVEQQDGTLVVTRRDDSRPARERHGLARTLVANMVTGVTEGFKKDMKIAGVGYRLQVVGSKLTITAGYSHPIEIELPKGVTIDVDQRATPIGNTKNQQGFNFSVKGIDKQAVGDIAAEIRAVRPLEPYKGKGIRYAYEILRLKAGKAGKK
ncbi:50S ribosomal protein L6 [Leptolyngbya sp. FACHB-261]|uniref:50S ribosomal protein L6 n=1 Tax=Leptolyngbya sp. FACHB-261 TaxID=2692806 RepID=UPI001688FF82|nr:50S ribosomal protein L6 [Leptolyngbya sp. FACHB-261]MBD2105237.1 50S ribosomal protein L6 [Leptolyngbya sp. FACHB-261]